jgi:hypothetical protein
MMAEVRSMISVPVVGSSTATKTRRRPALAITEPRGLQQARGGKNRTPGLKGGTLVNNFATFHPSSNDSSRRRSADGLDCASFDMTNADITGAQGNIGPRVHFEVFKDTFTFEGNQSMVDQIVKQFVKERP